MSLNPCIVNPTEYTFAFGCVLWSVTPFASSGAAAPPSLSAAVAASAAAAAAATAAAAAAAVAAAELAAAASRVCGPAVGARFGGVDGVGTGPAVAAVGVVTVAAAV